MLPRVHQVRQQGARIVEGAECALALLITDEGVVTSSAYRNTILMSVLELLDVVIMRRRLLSSSCIPFAFCVSGNVFLIDLYLERVHFSVKIGHNGHDLGTRLVPPLSNDHVVLWVVHRT